MIACHQTENGDAFLQRQRARCEIGNGSSVCFCVLCCGIPLNFEVSVGSFWYKQEGCGLYHYECTESGADFTHCFVDGWLKVFLKANRAASPTSNPSYQLADKRPTMDDSTIVVKLGWIPARCQLEMSHRFVDVVYFAQSLRRIILGDC